MDFTGDYIDRFMVDALAETGVEPRQYSRMAVYQTWAPFTAPPEDYPVAFIDSTSVKASDCVVMDNISGHEAGYALTSRLAKFSPDHIWYYVSDMQPTEMIVFKGNDTKFGDAQCVPHTAFDNRSNVAQANPRESIETRVFSYWK